VLRVLFEQAIGFTCLLADRRWQCCQGSAKPSRRMRFHSCSGSRTSVRPARCSASASSASCASRS
jgi:hypothetical protein